MSNEVILKPDKRLLRKWYLQYFLQIIIWDIVIDLFLLGFLVVIFNNANIYQLTIEILITLILLDVFLIIIIFLFLIKYFHTFEYTIASDHIETKKGLININFKYIPFRTITNINTTYGFFDRRFGIGSIMIETAGGNQFVGRERLVGLVNVKEIEEKILARIHMFKTPYTVATEVSLEENTLPENTTNKILGVELVNTTLTDIKEELIRVRKILEER